MHERTNIQLSRTDRSQLKAVVANRNSARVAPDVRKRQQDRVFPTLSQPIDPLLQEHGLAVARGGSDQGDRAGGKRVSQRDQAFPMDGRSASPATAGQRSITPASRSERRGLAAPSKDTGLERRLMAFESFCSERAIHLIFDGPLASCRCL